MRIITNFFTNIKSLFANPQAKGAPDPERLFADLSKSYSGESYDAASRYRDFREIFLSQPQGKKVLFEILTWSHMFQPVFLPGDPYATHYRDGERNIGLKIMAAINAEPSEEIIQAESEPEENQTQD
jgi:hypothetical protein